MVTAVERNNQTRRVKTFLRRLFARFKLKFHKTTLKQNVNIRDEFHYSEADRSMNAMGPVQSERDPLRSYFHELEVDGSMHATGLVQS